MRGLFSYDKNRDSDAGQNMVQDIGWKGMFGNDANNMIMGCCGSWIYNQYGWANLRQYNEALQVKQLQCDANNMCEWKPLMTYEYKRSLTTLESLVSRWPAVEDSPAYKNITEPLCGYGGQFCEGRTLSHPISLTTAAF